MLGLKLIHVSKGAPVGDDKIRDWKLIIHSVAMQIATFQLQGKWYNMCYWPLYESSMDADVIVPWRQ